MKGRKLVLVAALFVLSGTSLACSESVEELCSAEDEMVDLSASSLTPGRYFSMNADEGDPPILRVEESGEIELFDYRFGCELDEWPLVLGERVAVHEPFPSHRSYAIRLDEAVLEPGLLELNYTVASTPYAFDEGETEEHVIRLREVDPDRVLWTHRDPELPEEFVLYRLELEDESSESTGP